MMAQTNSFSMMTWNAHSIRDKKNEFFDYLILNEISVCCVSETFLRNDDTLSNPNYVIYRLDRESDNRGGGVAIIIHKSIQHKLLPCPNTRVIEALSVEFLVNERPLVITSIYFPGSGSPEILQSFRNEICLLANAWSEHIVTGDFNSRNEYWGCTSSNQAGTILYNEMNRGQFFIYHPDSPTHFPENGGNPSTLEIFLVKGSFIPTNIVTDVSLPSDHVPVLCSIVGSMADRESSSLVRNYESANWTQFASLVSQKIANHTHEICSKSDVDASITLLRQAITEAHDDSVPLRQVSPNTIPLPNSVKRLIGRRNAVRRQILRSRDPSTREELRTIRNDLKREIDQAIRDLTNERFGHALEKINNETGAPSQKLFRMSRFFKNRNTGIPMLKVSGRKLITSNEKCEALADNLSKMYAGNNSSNAATNRKVNSSVNQLDRTPIDPQTFTPLSISELQEAIRGLKNKKAPGPDKVQSRCLKKLPTDALALLLNIYNSCLQLGYFPDEWKTAEVICIRKPGKPADSPESYRGISLLSTLGKLFERLLLPRIQMFCDDHNVLPTFQYGFRRGRSTTHQLIRMTSKILEGINSRKSVGVLALDLRAAFDSVWHQGVTHKLISFGFPVYLTKLITSFLKDRKFRVRVGSSRSTARGLASGTPQGAVWSPTIFDIFVSDMPELREVDVFQFADDTAISATSHMTSAVINKLQRSSHKLSKYFRNWRIEPNLQKYEACLFTRKTASRHSPQSGISVDNGEVPWSSSIKNLGLHLDKRLTFRTHVEKVVQKGERLIRMLYPLISRNSKLNTRNKILLYKTMFRPVICYASPVWSACAKTHFLKAQRLQNKILKMMLGLHWRTRTTTVHEMAQIDMLKDHTNGLKDKFWHRCRYSDDSDIVQLYRAHLAESSALADQR